MYYDRFIIFVTRSIFHKFVQFIEGKDSYPNSRGKFKAIQWILGPPLSRRVAHENFCRWYRWIIWTVLDMIQSRDPQLDHEATKIAFTIIEISSSPLSRSMALCSSWPGRIGRASGKTTLVIPGQAFTKHSPQAGPVHTYRFPQKAVVAKIDTWTISKLDPVIFYTPIF